MESFVRPNRAIFLLLRAGQAQGEPATAGTIRALQFVSVLSTRLRLSFRRSAMTEEGKPMSVEEIVSAALQLPLDDRGEVVSRLQASMSTEDEVDRAWRAEVRRRIELINAGQVEWVDEDEIFAELDADP
jgi:Putative addiction module component